MTTNPIGITLLGVDASEWYDVFDLLRKNTYGIESPLEMLKVILKRRQNYEG